MLWALTSTEAALQAMTLTAIIKLLNPVLYNFAGPTAELAWLVVGVAAFRIYVGLLMTRRDLHPVTPWLAGFVVVVLAESLSVSLYPLVSIFKILSFGFIATAVMCGFYLSRIGSNTLDEWFIAVGMSIAILSIPTFFQRSIGFNLNGVGFQGVLAHPQNFGVFFAPLAGWAAGYLISHRQHKVIAAGTFIALSILIYLSRARTAALAVVLALAVVALIILFTKVAFRKYAMRGLKIVGVSAFIVLLALPVFGLKSVEDKAKAFIFKHERSGSWAANDTRSGGIRGQWRNFGERPLLGIGFGVSLDPSFMPIYDPTTGLPISAAVEKGFLPTAVLEETGLVGGLALLLVIVSLVRAIDIRSDLSQALVFCVCIFVNAGEMLFFSVSGLGLYLWLMIGWAASANTNLRRGSQPPERWLPLANLVQSGVVSSRF